MKIVLNILMVAAICLLTYLCVNSITTSTNFDKQKKLRETAIAQRLIDIRTAQIGYRNANRHYAANFEELQKFLNEQKLPYLIKEGNLTDDQLRAGMTEQEAVKQGIIRRDTTWVLAKDTLLGVSYDVASIDKVPGFEPTVFKLDTATLTSPAGYTVPVFEASVSYDSYLGDLDRQQLINLKDQQTKTNRFLGLRVGSITEINNNAGNWE